jgi:hypothetical protein
MRAHNDTCCYPVREPACGFPQAFAQAVPKALGCQ